MARINCSSDSAVNFSEIHGKQLCIAMYIQLCNMLQPRKTVMKGREVWQLGSVFAICNNSARWSSFNFVCNANFVDIQWIFTL